MHIVIGATVIAALIMFYRGLHSVAVNIRNKAANRGRDRNSTPVRPDTIERVDRAWALRQDGMSMHDIAQELGVTEGTVRRYLHIASRDRA